MPPLSVFVQLSALTSLTPEDLEGMMKCTPGELALLMRAYQDAGKVADTSTWEKIADVLHESLDWLPLAALILQAIALA